MKRVYLVGPMSGIPNHNYPAFRAAEDVLSRMGYVVLNPAHNFNERSDLPYDWYIREDLKLIAFADEIALLPGWEKSRGGNLEYHFACLIGLPMIEVTNWGYGSHYPTMETLIENLENIYANRT